MVTAARFEDRHRALLSYEDRELMGSIIGNPLRYPDMVIAPDGQPYLYRWVVFSKRKHAKIYFHIQVADDPERPLHDHPFDNFSTILSGGYDEIWCKHPRVFDHRKGGYEVRPMRVGDVCFRKAEEAHRLLLPDGIPYTMTLFSCGPDRREWGFWYPDGWRPFTDVTRTENGISTHVKRDVKVGVW